MKFDKRKLDPIFDQMLVHAVNQLPADVLSAIKEAHARETVDVAKKQLEAILNSASLSDQLQIPLCQDTGLVTLFISGDLINHPADIEKALVKALKKITGRGAMRPNVVHPLTRKNTESNTGLVTLFISGDLINHRADIEKGLVKALKKITGRGAMRPNVVHPLTRKNTESNTGLHQPEVLVDTSTQKTAMKMILKGAGSENFTNLRMMMPTSTKQDMFKHILHVVIDAGGKTCPPNILGIGIGGSAIQSLLNSKIALLRPVGIRNHDPQIAELETALLKGVNELGIGTMGLGGDTTALDVHIEMAGTHTACLPIAISFGCWANRVAVAELRGEKFRIVR